MFSGTGTSCIFALLGAKINNWSFVGTEIDIDSIDIARKNVKQNLLEKKIRILKSDEDTIFKVN